MVYRGSVKNGVVVLEGSPPLKEGTEVRVEPIEAEDAERGTAKAIARALASGAHWQGDPEEVDRFLARRKLEKQAEMRAQLDAEKHLKNPFDSGP
jgi:hypothetical protein